MTSIIMKHLCTAATVFILVTQHVMGMQFEDAERGGIVQSTPTATETRDKETVESRSMGTYMRLGVGDLVELDLTNHGKHFIDIDGKTLRPIPKFVVLESMTPDKSYCSIWWSEKATKENATPGAWVIYDTTLKTRTYNDYELFHRIYYPRKNTYTGRVGEIESYASKIAYGDDVKVKFSDSEDDFENARFNELQVYYNILVPMECVKYGLLKDHRRSNRSQFTPSPPPNGGEEITEDATPLTCHEKTKEERPHTTRPLTAISQSLDQGVSARSTAEKALREVSKNAKNNGASPTEVQRAAEQYENPYTTQDPCKPIRTERRGSSSAVSADSQSHGG